MSNKLDLGVLQYQQQRDGILAILNIVLMLNMWRQPHGSWLPTPHR